jgi:hypothetical protein
LKEIKLRGRAIRMIGQTKSFKEKQQKVARFIEEYDPYKPLVPLRFDLRGYTKYVKEHNISGTDVSEGIFEKFKL